MSVFSATAPVGGVLDEERVRELVALVCPAKDYRGKKVLLIIPDATRTAPIGLMFQLLHRQLGNVAQAFDVLIALGEHPPMSDAAILRRLEITPDQRRAVYGRVRIMNHACYDPTVLRQVGVIPANEIGELSGGLFAMDLPVQINHFVFDYDQIIIVGPVFPHETVGFSGGNKYLFPGLSSSDGLHFLHWFGAVVTSPMIIGRKWTPVGCVVDRAAAFVSVDKICFCLIMDEGQFMGIFAGDSASAWDAASDLSAERHITYKERAFHTILSYAPRMYDDLWMGGKCVSKLEPVLADDGELIIYAPHITRISEAYGSVIEEVGYHCRDYFLKQWDQFKQHPWDVLAHLTLMYGIGTYDNGVERPRARITLATGISQEICEKINLGYRDPKTISSQDFSDRENEGILFVPKADERLFLLQNPPPWAGG